MTSFSPYETFDSLTDVTNSQHADRLLITACEAHEQRSVHTQEEELQFIALVGKLFPKVSDKAREETSVILAACLNLPQAVQSLVAQSAGKSIAHFLQYAPSLTERTMIETCATQNIDACMAIAKRDDLTDRVLECLFPVNSRGLYRALAANFSLRFEGRFQNAMVRAAKMDAQIASSLAERDQFDTALLANAFFNLKSDHQLQIIEAHADREFPRLPLGSMIEQISVATDELARALTKLFSQNRRAEVTKLLQQITGLDEIKCGTIAHDVTGESLFVILRAFGCRASEGLRVLIHSRSHDAMRDNRLTQFSVLFDQISVEGMIYLLAVWRGDVDPLSYGELRYISCAEELERRYQRGHQALLSPHVRPEQVRYRWRA